jgi:hypothetical protein
MHLQPPPDIASLQPRAFLGFPNIECSRIELDGDIVILNGPNGAGKSTLLEALAYYASGGCFRSGDSLVHDGAGRFELKFDTATLTGGEDETPSVPAWWYPAEEKSSRKSHARAVYFHPHYLRRLLEEDAVKGESLADLLAPPPQTVAELTSQLAQVGASISAMRDEAKRSSGLPDEDARKDARRAFAADFNTTLDRWSSTAPEVASWFEGCKRDKLVIRSGNLRNGWEQELVGITRHLLTRMAASPALAERGVAGLADQITDKSTVPETLRVLAAAADHAATQSAASEAKTAADLARLPAIVINRLRSFSVEEWRRFQDHPNHPPLDKMATDLEIKQLVEHLTELRATREILGRAGADVVGSPYNFPALLDSWQRVLGKRNIPGSPASSLVKWFQDLAAHLRDWPKVDTEWKAWCARLEVEEIEQATRLAAMQQQRRETEEHKSLLASLNPVLSQRPQLRAMFASCQNAAEFLDAESSFGPLVPAPVNDAATAAKLFADTCRRWAEKEESFRQEDQRAREIGIEKPFVKLDALVAAVQTEAGKKGQLATLQERRLEERLKPLETFIEQSAARFRLFEGLLPVKIGFTGQKKGPRTLSIRVGRSGRPIEHTSTGQRSQLGLLFFLAVHYALRDTYRSPFICLDEITANFDRAQIPRLALLLRQIAYAENPVFRRRIFLASHNVDFSRQLVQQLRPPAGRKLRLLEFNGFTPTAGPLISSHLIEPMPSMDANWASLATSYFAQRYGMTKA